MKEKRINVFLINVVSDFGLVVMDEGRDIDEKFEKVSVNYEFFVVFEQMRYGGVF